MTGTIPIVAAIFSGTLIFVIGQIIQRIYIEPIQQLQRLIGEVIASVTYFSNTGDRVVELELQKEARQTLRRHSGQLIGVVQMIPNYDLWRRIARLPDERAIGDAAGGLILMSNTVGSSSHDVFDQARQQIIKALKLEVTSTGLIAVGRQKMNRRQKVN